MDREAALRWCVAELEAWPRAMSDISGSPDGWAWHTGNSGFAMLPTTGVSCAYIREEDWQVARNAAPTEDLVNHPKHYQLLPGVEVYDIRQALAAKATAAGVTLDQFSDYDRAIEYLLRMWEKNGKQDAEKAVWYLNKLIGKLQS